jgi:hypothetical protein
MLTDEQGTPRRITLAQALMLVRSNFRIAANAPALSLGQPR